MVGEVHLGDNLPILRGMAAGSVDLVYLDPPFNTRTTRRHPFLKAFRMAERIRSPKSPASWGA